MPAKKAPPLKDKIIDDLERLKKHLSLSYKKVLKIDLAGTQELDDETLETLESFSSRFARFSDLLISQYFRWLAKEKDPAFRGSITDLLNLAEKHGWIHSASTWFRTRELRNLAAHEYTAEDYKKLYAELIVLTPNLLETSLK